MPTTQQSPASEAFSAQSVIFDAIDRENAIIQWMRQKVYNHVDQLLTKPSHILELNAGTGIDALHFASQGHTVHATELAEGMVSELTRKTSHESNITVQQCDFTQLDNVQVGPFDLVFSNFGGLNCIPDLKAVTQHLQPLLKPGAFVTWVLIPRFCPWEVAHALKGNFKLAFRRFKKGGSQAHVEGKYFQCYYFSASEMLQALGSDFQLYRQEHLALFVPPPYQERFPQRWPGLFRMLQRWDNATKSWPLLRHWGDHIIVTAQYRPK